MNKLVDISSLKPGDLFKLKSNSWGKMLFIGKIRRQDGEIRYIRCSYWNESNPGNPWPISHPKHRIRHVGRMKEGVDIDALRRKYNLQAGESFITGDDNAPDDAEYQSKIQNMLPGVA